MPWAESRGESPSMEYGFWGCNGLPVPVSKAGLRATNPRARDLSQVQEHRDDCVIFRRSVGSLRQAERESESEGRCRLYMCLRHRICLGAVTVRAESRTNPNWQIRIATEYSTAHTGQHQTPWHPKRTPRLPTASMRSSRSRSRYDKPREPFASRME